MHDWKSTISGILTGLIGTLSSLMSYQVPAALLTPEQTHTWLWISVFCNLGCIIGKVWLGIITKNADAQSVANAINNVADIGPGAVPSTAASLTAPPPAIITPKP
jgi:hypothetical protein